MKTVKLYFRASCPHSQLLHNAFKKNKVVFDLLDISNSQEYTEELKEITGGYLSVPTVVFPDGQSMVEPSINSSLNYLRKQYPELVLKEKKSFLSFLKKKGQS